MIAIPSGDSACHQHRVAASPPPPVTVSATNRARVIGRENAPDHGPTRTQRRGHHPWTAVRFRRDPVRDSPLAPHEPGFNIEIIGYFGFVLPKSCRASLYFR